MLELLIIILISLLWSLFLGELSLFNLTVGALLALLLLSVIQREQEHNFSQRFRAVLFFVYRFFIELFMANLVIARLAFSARPKFNPHVIAVPLKLESDAAISLLAATITLLPGTVAMGVSEDKSLLYAHAMGEADVAKAKDSITRIETLILGFMN
ncbi:MAG: Na+/H+ antiporter subunit E [Trueperaceae bacterium]|nr:Na+/H+ antiporter subunit E [Trueperaceae bacterium]